MFADRNGDRKVLIFYIYQTTCILYYSFGILEKKHTSFKEP